MFLLLIRSDNGLAIFGEMEKVVFHLITWLYFLTLMYIVFMKIRTESGYE